MSESVPASHSCPQCGKTAIGGSDLEKIFGFRAMGNSIRVQSWCIECRNRVKNSEQTESQDYMMYIDSEKVKKESPVYEDVNPDKKTFGDLKEFIEEGMKLQANYQIVMLNYLLLHKIAHRGQIAEELALHNNQDSSDIEVVKKFFDVPAFEVLEKRGFVTTATPYEVTHFVLNVDLTEFQEMAAHEMLQKKLEEYNNAHSIFYDPYPTSAGIDWEGNKELLWKHSKAKKSEQMIWIWSVTPDNWDILVKQNVWGSKIPKYKIREKVHENDLVVFYVVGTNSFKGIFRFVGDWYNAKNPIWSDEKESIIYQSRVAIKPEQVGDASIHDLADKLEIFKEKDRKLMFLALKGTGGYPSNGGKPISHSDYDILKNELSVHASIRS